MASAGWFPQAGLPNDAEMAHDGWVGEVLGADPGDRIGLTEAGRSGWLGQHGGEMGIIDRLRSMFGGSKDADRDGVDDVVEEEEAIATVRQDINRSGLDAVNRLADTPGSSDRGTWG